ncbi:zinc finger protein OZF-like [Armigeres subalbatus]|uniref:zinc finger protein OZF-like n=1 Tax=Armigeres subalbatus TaxID=124917 RepID=UPI002ED5A267
MEHKVEKLSCRICLSEEDESQRMWPLFEICLEQKTPADIIQFCFGVEVAENSTVNDEICTNCKTDLQAAYRFLKQLKRSETLKDMAPKVEIGIFYGNEEQYISEVEIKTENADEYMEEAVDTKGIIAIEQIHTKRERTRRKLDTIIPLSKDKQKSPQKNTSTKMELLSSSEEEQNFDDNSDDEHNFTSEDEDFDERPTTKRLYSGTKPKPLPKRCCSCKEPLDSQEKVQKHSDQYHLSSRITNPKEYGDRLFECTVCYQRFNTKILFLRHQRKMYVDELHPCPRCEEEFANAFVLKKHIKFDHKKQFKTAQMEEMRSKANLCCVCKERFPTVEDLREHVKNTHARDQVLCETSNTFECDVCYHRFKTFKSLKHHQLRFFKEKKFVCTLCGKCFREKVRLSEHENLHRKIAPFQCAICPAKFAIKNSFEVHVKMHAAEEIYNCEYCGKGFRKKSLLMGHLQIHDTDRPYKCQLCPITFTRQNLLDAHLLAHSGSKPHKCQQCAASYIHQRDLRRHIREKHEGIRSFKCHLCPKAYIRHKLLEGHLKTHDD